MKGATAWLCLVIMILIRQIQKKVKTDDGFNRLMSWITTLNHYGLGLASVVWVFSQRGEWILSTFGMDDLPAQMWWLDWFNMTILLFPGFGDWSWISFSLPSYLQALIINQSLFRIRNSRVIRFVSYAVQLGIW
jgi:hypothetical protein